MNTNNENTNDLSENQQSKVICSTDLLCRFILSGNDIEIVSKNLLYCNYYNMYKVGDGIGMQCNYQYNSKEYSEILNICNNITMLMRKLKNYTHNAQDDEPHCKQ